MVASIGSIIPEPFAIPPTTISWLPIRSGGGRLFGNGSVVAMARGGAAPVNRQPRMAAGKADRTLSIGRSVPMTPVE